MKNTTASLVRLAAPFAIVATLGFANNALAATMEPLAHWGVLATTATFNCTSANAGKCDDGSIADFEFGPFDGGLSETSALSEFTSTNPTGHAKASAELDPADGLATPVLKAQAFSDTTDGSALANASAIEQYTNTTGSAINNIVIDINLDATIVDSTPADGATRVEAEALVVILSPGATDPVLLVLELLAATPEDTVSLSIDAGVVGGMAADSLTFDLAAGESAFFLTTITAQAIRDMSSADSFGTLTASFQGGAPAGLTAASNPGTPNAVAEPATIALLLTAAGFMGWTRRQSKS